MDEIVNEPAVVYHKRRYTVKEYPAMEKVSPIKRIF